MAAPFEWPPRSTLLARCCGGAHAESEDDGAACLKARARKSVFERTPHSAPPRLNEARGFPLIAKRVFKAPPPLPPPGVFPLPSSRRRGKLRISLGSQRLPVFNACSGEQMVHTDSDWRWRPGKPAATSDAQLDPMYVFADFTHTVGDVKLALRGIVGRDVVLMAPMSDNDDMIILALTDERKGLSVYIQPPTTQVDATTTGHHRVLNYR